MPAQHKLRALIFHSAQSIHKSGLADARFEQVIFRVTLVRRPPTSPKQPVMSTLKVDIVSDVVCPWCIVGFKQLEKALEKCHQRAEIHWHPFELNPTMPESGQLLSEHITEKYGSSESESAENRRRLTELGDSLGFSFGYTEKSRMVNTFKAHQLLHWAGQQGVEQEHALKMALFSAYFTDQQDVNRDEILMASAAVAELDASDAQAVLQDGRFETDVRKREQLWSTRGITGVPAMIFEDKYLVTGAQGIENYMSVIEQINEERNTSTPKQ